MKYLNKRKFPRGIKRLHAGSQLLLHIGSTLEKGTRVTRGDYPAPVCLKDTTAKRRKLHKTMGSDSKKARIHNVKFQEVDKLNLVPTVP